MLSVILLEMAHLRYVRGGVIPWKEVIFNLNSGHLLMWLLRGVEVLLFTLTYRHFSLHAVEGWPGWALWTFAFVAWDFSFYWMHRLHHKLPLLWQVHVVHHQGEHFNLSLGVRNSWYSSLTSFPFVAGLAVAGVPPEVFVVVSSLHYTVQFYNHNGIVKRSGWLEHLFITPSHHRVHHGTHPLYVDRNFGGTLLLWDQLFGSFQPERADIPVRYGVVGERCGSDNPLWANNQVLHRAWRRRFNVEAGMPEAAVPQAFVGLGGVLLFVLVIHFVNHQSAWSASEFAALFAWIFLGTLALGGVSDGRRWGLPAWAFITTVGAAAWLWGGSRHDVFAVLSMGLLMLHGADALRRAWLLRSTA